MCDCCGKGHSHLQQLEEDHHHGDDGHTHPHGHPHHHHGHNHDHHHDHHHDHDHGGPVFTVIEAKPPQAGSGN